jgi:hypothetical protein
MSRLQRIAYQAAQWAVARRQRIERLATVLLWAECNNIELNHDEALFVLNRWHDYVTITYHN